MACRKMPLITKARSFLRRLDWFYFIPLGLVLAVSVLNSFFRSADLLFLLLGALALFIWLCLAATRLLIALWNKSWSHVIAVIASIGLTVLLGRPLLMAGDYVHLAVMYPYYQDEIYYSNGERMIFNWGGGGFAGSTTDYYLVYDRSGTLQKTGVLQLSPGGLDLSVSVRHLVGSFYLASYS
jgi:hypothetical protein